MKETLNLTENPFDPEWDGMRRGPEPLGMEASSNMPDLVCRQVAGFGEAEAKLLRAVFPLAADPRIKRSAILLIVGPIGSGRTTLANLVLSRIAKAASHWGKFSIEFDPYIPPDNVRARFETVRSEIHKDYGDGEGSVLVRIENLPQGEFNYVMSTFAAFPRLKRVFVVTTSDLNLLTKELNAASMHIEVSELKKLPADEVAILIKDRLPKFRAAQNNVLDAEPDLALFPFGLDAPRSTSDKPLQMVRYWAAARIDTKHAELELDPALADARQADAGELRTRLIAS